MNFLLSFLLPLCLSGLTLGQLPDSRLEVTELSTGQSALCWETNSIDVSFADKTTLLVDYKNLRIEGFPSSGICAFNLGFRNMPRGYRFRFGNASWTGHAKFTGGHSMREMYTGAKLNFEKYTETNKTDKDGFKIWEWRSNTVGLTQWGPKVSWGKDGDFDSDFEMSAGPLFGVPAWTPCVIHEVDVSRYRWSMGISVQVYMTQTFLPEGEAIFGRPYPQPALTQKIGLEWEACV